MTTGVFSLSLKCFLCYVNARINTLKIQAKKKNKQKIFITTITTTMATTNRVQYVAEKKKD